MRFRGVLVLVLLGVIAAAVRPPATAEEPPPAATRRAYAGAPPVIPHAPTDSPCIACHDATGGAVEGMGFAPAFPHDATGGEGSVGRCQQCHVYRRGDTEFVGNRFAGRSGAQRRGDRLNAYAPPRLPHPLRLHERCLACHGASAKRAAMRTPHPERLRCLQCHVPGTTTDTFTPPTP